MTVAENHVLTPTHVAIDAYSKAKEPKHLNILKGAGHFDGCEYSRLCETQFPRRDSWKFPACPYLSSDTGKWFKQNSQTQVDFFKKAFEDQ